MRKYIRTKNNRIVKVDVENGIYTSKYELIGEPKNTIEELCDEFVLVKDNYKTLLELEANRSIKNGFLKDIKTGWLSFIDDYLEQDYELYAAIWTKWGLKYVAKMNDKGELELI